MTLRVRHWDRLGNGGISFTELGFGAAPLGNLYRAISNEEAQAALACAWDGGMRYFDTAPLYGFGLSETRLGSFLHGKPRDDYVLSSKVGRLLRVSTSETRDGVGKWFQVPSRTEMYDYSYDGVMRSLEFSLERLGVDRIDILYAHDLDTFNHGSQKALEARLTEFMEGGYKALLELRDQGVIRAFGAGVNEWQPCQWLAERGDFDLFLLAGRYTLLEQDAQESFLPMARDRGIGIVIGGAFNSGILATGPHPGAHYNYAPATPEILDRVARIQVTCDGNGVRLLDAALRFPLLHPAVVSVLPGGQGKEQIKCALASLRKPVPALLWEELKARGLMRADAPTG